jgi:carbonic anhydrase
MAQGKTAVMVQYESNSEYSSSPISLPTINTKIVSTGTTVNQCGGSNQTPINFNPLSIQNDPTLKYPTFTEKNGGCSTWDQGTDDHALEVSFSKTGHVCQNHQVNHQGEDYSLLQFHFHSPAEHTVGSGYADAELHMVHKSSSGKYLVVGVMMNEIKSSIRGSSNVFLERIWEAATASSGASTATDDGIASSVVYEWLIVNSTVPLHAYDLLPPDKEYWTYKG